MIPAGCAQTKRLITTDTHTEASVKKKKKKKGNASYQSLLTTEAEDIKFRETLDHGGTI